MFALFFSLYVAMFRGTWGLYTFEDISAVMLLPIKGIGILLTSMFNDVSTPMDSLHTFFDFGNIVYLTSFVLALITSIGIVVLAVKGIKRIFAVFFTFGR